MIVYWYSWLGFFGLVLGLAISGILGWSALRSGLTGLAAGIAAVLIINLTMPTRAPCLPEAKGWIDILRAYDLSCERNRADAAAAKKQAPKQ